MAALLAGEGAPFISCTRWDVVASAAGSRLEIAPPTCRRCSHRAEGHV